MKFDKNVKRITLATIAIFSIKGIISLSIILFGVHLLTADQEVIGNQKVLAQITELLPPIDSRNITEDDFTTLQKMVKSDEHASDEVEELITLAKYKEYSHIGHGVGFLYEYVKTGNESVCPGHHLAHYYVFQKYNESSLAEDNLHEAKELYPEWKESIFNKDSSYFQDMNVSYYDSIINQSISSINQGNLSVTEDRIYELAEAPCV